ncbi:MAG: peptidoglycan editing factor PgeF [Candidatus Omnitrophica bacterium]|nr:peptidoglycan editing factor PgeF [Candidatus Omnitrophota bacterium]
MSKTSFSADVPVIYAFSARKDGNMSLSYGDTGDSLDSRRKFLSGLGIDYKDLVCAKQVHGARVIYAREGESGKGALSYDNALEDTDALVTDKKNLPLAIFTADCLSVFLYDALTPAAGVVHAGWRSSKENITAAAIKLMQKEFNSRVENIYLSFGPALRKCCYKVSADFKDHFGAEFFSEQNGSYYFDLVGLNKKQATACGIREGNISDCQICTSCSGKEFFSYRKEAASCGRMISVIMLR